MMPAMGRDRKSATAIIAAVLLLGGGAAYAADSPQAGWTPLPDPNAGFRPDQAGLRDQALLDRSIADFSANLAREIGEQRAKHQQACQASLTSNLNGDRRADWQARCSYRRY
jgi:hypothetical protein